MIKALIFDFGDVFINLDKQGAINHALKLFDLSEFPPDLWEINMHYEIGAISTEDFLSFYTNKFPNLTENNIIDAWNYIIKDFPVYRLDFLRTLKLKTSYKLILLSNTNTLHIELVKQRVSFYDEFKSCFDAFYLSHEINLRKPNASIFEFVLSENNLEAQTCLFIDDTKENTDAAKQLGFQTWNIDETNEDIINLFQIKKDLF